MVTAVPEVTGVPGVTEATEATEVTADTTTEVTDVAVTAVTTDTMATDTARITARRTLQEVRIIRTVIAAVLTAPLLIRLDTAVTHKACVCVITQISRILFFYKLTYFCINTNTRIHASESLVIIYSLFF